MNLLAIRLSAMGDVALTLPAIRSVLDQHPELTINLLTREQFIPFFSQIPRLNCIIADVKGRHKGIQGLYRLYKDIMRSNRPDAVLDLHHVLRSRILSFYFKNAGIPVYRINKGRREKKRLTAKYHKALHPLPSTVQRYLKVFKHAGIPAVLSTRKNWFNKTGSPELFLQNKDLWPKHDAWIGIAPFAKHREKMWPFKKMEAVIAYLGQKKAVVFLFGGGSSEITVLKKLAANYKHVVVVAGALSIEEELGLISQLDMMISMDSANMHLAALAGVPVISIWGATHPFAGFGPIGDNEKYMVQISTHQLTCRPCSVFGNKPCWRGDHACMEWIDPEMVLEKIKLVLNKP